MTKTIALEDLEHELRGVLDDIASDHTAYVVTRGDRPAAALVSYGEFRKLAELEETRVLAQFDALMARMERRNTGISEDEIASDVAVETAR